MEMFFKLYEGLDREGPGMMAMSRRAYRMCKGLPDKPAILELYRTHPGIYGYEFHVFKK